MKQYLLTTSLLASVLIPSTQAMSQVNTGQSTLEEIIVTAQRRSERLQDVPISVAAVTSDSLAQANIRSTVNLQTVVPGLVTYQTVSSFQPFIRGVGSNIASPGLENPVAVYLDGVYMSSKAASVFELGTIERIEVIKGPQGTLFGRNATGGAISVTTRRPGDTQEISGEIGYGRFDELVLKGSAIVPVSDTLKVMVSGSFRKDGGYIKDLVGGGTEGKVNQYAALGKILWTPTDRLELEATYIQYKTSNNAANLVHNFPGQHVVFPAGTINATGKYESSWDFIPTVRSRSRLAIGKLKYDLSDQVSFVSISSYQDTKGLLTVDSDRTSAHLAYNRQVEEGHSYSQEFQLQSAGNDRLTWIAGLYYYRNVTRTLPTESRSGLSNDLDPALLSGVAFVAPSVTRFYTKMPTTSYAAFAQLTYEIGDGHLTGGLRYTIDKKSLANQVYFVNRAGEEVPIVGRSADTGRSFKKPTWRLSYDHKIAPDVLAYVSYNRGFKSGGYNPTVTANAAGQPKPVKPEVLDAYEVGIKSELLDRHLRANVSAFYYNYKDILVNSINAVTFLSELNNAASARHYGVDVDLNASVSQALSLRASATYLHAKYRDFPNAVISVPGPTGGAVPLVADASGENVIFAPKFTATLGADYTIDLPNDSRVVLSSTYYYNDGFDTQPLGGRTSIPSYSNVSASATWHLADDRYFVRIWGDNLTNAKRPIFKLGGAYGFGGIYAKPVTYGASVGFKF